MKSEYGKRQGPYKETASIAALAMDMGNVTFVSKDPQMPHHQLYFCERQLAQKTVCFIFWLFYFSLLAQQNCDFILHSQLL